MFSGRWNIWGTGFLFALFTGIFVAMRELLAMGTVPFSGCCSHALSALLLASRLRLCGIGLSIGHDSALSLVNRQHLAGRWIHEMEPLTGGAVDCLIRLAIARCHL